MIKPIRISLAIISNLLITSFTIGDSGTVTIRGSVVDDSGKPIPFATVVLTKDANTPIGTISDSNGDFKIGNVERGNYNLKVSCIGYGSEYIRDVLIEAEDVILEFIELSWGIDYPEVVCSDYRPYCDKPCGRGCICECCVPMEDFEERSRAQKLKPIISIDTSSFQTLESWWARN